MLKSNKKRSNFFSDSAILGSTPNNEIPESKKVLVLESKRFLISGVILGFGQLSLLI